MSAKIMGLVWDADLDRDKKYVLLAYADHADHDGENVFPSIPKIAWKTGYSERQVQRITQELVQMGILVPQGESEYGTNQFKINTKKLPQRPGFVPQRRGRPSKNGVTVSPIIEENGDIPAENGDKTANNGDTVMSPEPSLKPSINPLSLSGSDGGQKLHDLLAIEYRAKGRRPPEKFKTVEMQTRWLTECEARLAPAELEKAIRAALAMSITDLPRLVAYVAKWGTQPRPTYAGSANGKAKPTAAEIKPSAANQDNTRGVYI